MEPESRNPTADDERRIVELFAHREPIYDLPTVRRLTGLTLQRLEAALAEGHVDPVMDGCSLRLTWEDVANLALERWTPREIARTLERTGYPYALPPLSQVRTIAIELPVYQIRLLHHLAEEQSVKAGASRSVSDILENELAALAAENTAAMDKRFAGFEVASLFPKPFRAQHIIETCCLYCGEPVEEAEEICSTCARRHVPAL